MSLLSSATASLPIEPSGPGYAHLAVLRGADVGEAAAPRPRSTASSRSSRGDGVPPLRRAATSTALTAAGDRRPSPSAAIAPPIDTRSFISVVSDTRQPSPGSPSISASGMRASVKYTSLNSASPVIWRSGRTSTPGACMSTTNAVRPACLTASGSVRTTSRPHLETWASVVHTFWPLTIHSSPSARRGDDRPAKSEPEPGSREQLAPDLLAGEQRTQVALLLLLAPPLDDRRAAHAVADRVAVVRVRAAGGEDPLVDRSSAASATGRARRGPRGSAPRPDPRSNCAPRNVGGVGRRRRDAPAGARRPGRRRAARRSGCSVTVIAGRLLTGRRRPDSVDPSRRTRRSQPRSPEPCEPAQLSGAMAGRTPRARRSSARRARDPERHHPAQSRPGPGAAA